MKRVEIESRRRLLDDFLKVDEARLRFERTDGTLSDVVRRLSLERGDSVAAILYHRERHRVLLVRQFRYPAHAAGDGWLVEAVAGMIEPEEPPEQAMRREIAEEAGYAVRHLVPVSRFFTSPGGSSERVFLYFAEITEAQRVGDGGGDHDEDVEIVWLSLDEVRAGLAAGDFRDAKTIIGLQWLLARSDP